MQGCLRISFRKPRNAFHLASAILLRRNDRPLPSKEPWSFCTFRPTRVRRITLTAPNDLSFDGVQSAVSDLLHLGSLQLSRNSTMIERRLRSFHRVLYDRPCASFPVS